MFRFRSQKKRQIPEISGVKISLFFLLFILSFSVVAEAEGRVKVAVLPWVGKDKEDAYWGYFLRDIIKMGLEENDEIEICDPLLSDEVVREARISWSDVLMPSTAKIIGERIGCSYLLTGSCRYRLMAGRERILVSARLFEIESGSYSDIPSEIFDIDNLPDLVEYIVEESLSFMGLDYKAPIYLPPFAIDNLLPLYRGVQKMEEALQTYGEAQYPDKPLWREAFSLAEETITKEPEYLDAYGYLAYMYRKTNWWAKEVETWDLYLQKLQERGEKIDSRQISQTYLRLAYSYFNQKNFNLARESLQKATEISPQWAEPYLLWARIEYEDGNVEEAEKLYSRAFELDPSLKEAEYFAQLAGKAKVYGKSAYEAYVAGYQSFAAGNLERAEQYLQEAISLNPEMKEAYYWLGRTLYDAGKLREAEKAWEKVLEIDPFHSQARRFLDKTQQEAKYGREALNYFRQGYDLYQEGRYEEAADLFRQALRVNPMFSDAHDYLARCYFRLGKTEEYVREREESVKLEGSSREKAWQYYQIGYELFSWGETEKALQMLEKAINEDPSLADAHLLLGEIYGDKGNWAKSREHYLRALEELEGESRGAALWGAAVASFHLEDWAESLSLLNELVVSHPYGEFIEEAEVMRMEALVREGNYEEAQRSFQQFLVRFPQSPFLQRARFWYASSFYQAKNWEKAQQLLEEFLRLYPESVYRSSTIEMLGYTYRNLGKETEAQKYFSQLEGEEGAFLTADAYYREKEWGKAISSFEEYLSRYPQSKFSLEARFKLASSYLEMGNPDKAQELIKGWEGELQNKFKKDFLPFSIKLHAQKEEWSKVKEEILRLEKETGELGEEYSLLLALAHSNLGEEEEAKKVLAKAGKEPEEILISSEKEEAQEILDLMEREDYSSALSRLEVIKGEEHPLFSQSTIDFLEGKCYYQLGDFSKAFDLLSRALASPEESFQEEALFYYLNSAYHLQKWDKVIEAYSRMKNKDDSSVRFRAALAYYYSGNHEESIPILRSLQNDPDFSSSATSLLVEELFLIKDYSQCAEEAEKFLDTFPPDSQRERVLYLASWAFYYSDDLEKAEELIKSYQTEFPGGKYGEELSSLLADLYLFQGEVDKAIAILREIEESSDHHRKLYTWYRLGNAYLGREDFAHALPYFQNIFQAGESEYQTVAGYQWGVCLEYLDRIEEAKDVYQAVIETGRKDQWVSKAQERWDVLTK